MVGEEAQGEVMEALWGGGVRKKEYELSWK